MKIQLNHFLILGLVGLLFQSTIALTQTNEIQKSFSASQLIQSFEDKHREYKKFFEHSDPIFGNYDLNHFSIIYTLQKATSQLISTQIYTIDPDEVLKVLIQINNQKNKNTASTTIPPIRVVSEFNLLKSTLHKRGYEIQPENDKFLFTKFLSLYYVQPLTISTLHDLNFEYKIYFQNKSQELQFGDEFPILILRGSILFDCNDSIQNCKVFSLKFKEAAIAWSIFEQRGRGASSSAGGN